jgi:hypothetical protein
MFTEKILHEHEWKEEFAKSLEAKKVSLGEKLKRLAGEMEEVRLEREEEDTVTGVKKRETLKIKRRAKHKDNGGNGNKPRNKKANNRTKDIVNYSNDEVPMRRITPSKEDIDEPSEPAISQEDWQPVSL